MILTRDIKSSKHSKLDAIEKEVIDFGVSMFLIKSSHQAAENAATRGWILEAAISSIQQAVESY